MSGYLTFLAASVVIAATPGPSWLYVISRTVGQGGGAGLVAVAGNASGIGVHMAGVILGLSLVIQQSATAFTVLKIAGALYLAFLGIQMMRHGPKVAGRRAVAKRLSTVFGEAVLVNVTNPKVALLFLAFLPQFVEPAAGNVPLQIASLGAIHIVVACLVTLILVALAKRIGPAFSSSPALRGFFRWGVGAAFLAMAARVAIASRY